MSAVSLGNKKDVDMTQGKIFPLLMSFAVPLLLGNLFQQLYNTVDTWVVGNYVGKISFSAVGTVGPVVNTLIGFFLGFSSGATVVIAKAFGAKNEKEVKIATHTYVAVTLILCVVFTILGVALVPLMLRILKSPTEVAAEQRIYLVIYFAGISGLLIYNMGSAILRAVGNSKQPFIFLCICVFSNIFLDLLFVLVFHMGTAGVAYATIIAQFISAAMVIIVLLRTDSVVKVTIKDIKIEKKVLKDIFGIGLPAALQMSITAFSNVFVQSYINHFGTDVMGGWTAYGKIDMLFFLPMQSIALATTTFVGQNLGSNDIKRARDGVKYSLYMALVSTAVLVSLVYISAESLVSIFIDDAEVDVIHYGVFLLRMNGPFFLFACFNQVYNGALRGCGKSSLGMIGMVGSFVVFRQIYLYIFANYISNTFTPIAFSYPAGWALCSILMTTFYLVYFPKVDRKKD